MTLLTASTRIFTLDLRVNDSRDPVDLVEQIARVLDVGSGEQDNHEWIQLMHIRNINKEN